MYFTYFDKLFVFIFNLNPFSTLLNFCSHILIQIVAFFLTETYFASKRKLKPFVYAVLDKLYFKQHCFGNCMKLLSMYKIIMVRLIF